MSKNKSFGSFQSTARRRSSLPLIPIALVVLLIAIIAILWSRGGEQPQQPVEKVIPAEKLGK